MFNLYPVRIHLDICDQNSPHGFLVDSKLLTLPMHTLAWAVDIRVSVETVETAATLFGVLDDFSRPECDHLLVSL